MRIWIDTDVGSDVDDALAIAYVLRDPRFELVGVSTAFGDVALRTRIATELLRVANAPAVPVVTGLGVPLTRRRKGVMFGHEGRGIVDAAPPELRIEREEGGDDRIESLRRALDAAAPDVLLAIGPLTNLGALVRAGVALPQLAVMGGRIGGNARDDLDARIAEWNWFSDPDAVRVVLDAPRVHLPRLVPNDVTLQTQLEAGDVERLAKGDALARKCAELCGHWLDAQTTIFGSKQPLVRLHDPLAAAVLVEPGLCPFEERAIHVDDTGAGHPADHASNVSAAVDVDPEATRIHLMETWLA